MFITANTRRPEGCFNYFEMVFLEILQTWWGFPEPFTYVRMYDAVLKLMHKKLIGTVDLLEIRSTKVPRYIILQYTFTRYRDMKFSIPPIPTYTRMIKN